MCRRRTLGADVACPAFAYSALADPAPLLCAITPQSPRTGQYQFCGERPAWPPTREWRLAHCGGSPSPFYAKEEKRAVSPSSNVAGQERSQEFQGRKAASRNTDSGPSHPSRETAGDALADKAAATDALVAQVPVNTNKPGEFGRENAVCPMRGFSFAAADPARIGRPVVQAVSR